MRNVLGLHFGHDGAACVVSDGRVQSYLLTERRTRIKHAGGVPPLVIDEVLRHARMDPADVDFVTVTSTQNRECLFENPEVFSFEFGANGLSASIDEAYLRMRDRLEFSWRIRTSYRNREINPQDPNLKQWPYYSEKLPAVGYPSVRFRVRRIEPKAVLESSRRENGLLACTLPVNCTLFGRRVPGFFVDHHAAHCASVFYKSPFEQALVISADGGMVGNFGGFAMLGHSGGLSLIETHEFVGGSFYSSVAERIGLDAGKLMGLSGHGTPTGRTIPLTRREHSSAVEEFLGRFSATEITKAADDPMSDPGRSLAADAQASFENEFSALTTEIVDYLAPVLSHPAICLSGGCALNCPTNSILMERYGERQVFIESACNDEGLAFGGAAWAFANLFGGVIDAEARGANRSPFQGGHPAEITRALEIARRDGLEIVSAKDDARKAMRDGLLRGEIGGVMRGKSEIGPRALGNRSLIGRADIGKHHFQINTIKHREQWRPLAPMVPDDLFGKYFSGPRNPFMLATCHVASDRTPAARHADGSARVQTLATDDDLYPELAYALEAGGAPGVLINTSFNGRDQPLLDDACDAIDMMLKHDNLRFVLIEDTLVSKPPARR